MKILGLVLIFIISLAGCSIIKIPSFWDPNQATSIINVQIAIERINCNNLKHRQITAVTDEIQWFQMYSKSSGRRHQDVIQLIQPLDKTIEAFENRFTKENTINPTYCKLKKRNMQQQSARAARTILGRLKL